MSIKLKSAGTWRTVTQPWVKVDGVWKKATKVFVKVNGAWVETYPLQPGPVGAPVATTTYRNDRIEIDVDWTAPTTGEATTKYIVTANIGTVATGPFAYTTTVTVNAPTTALTLTNAGSGYAKWAGSKLFVSIYAQSAAGRNGPAVSATAVTIAQLPAPPVPTTYTVSIDDCKASHHWTITTDNRVTGVELLTQFNGVGDVIKTYPDNVLGASYQSWNPATTGGGTVTCKLRTYGPGGKSAWKTVTGTMPAPVHVSNYRFTAGRLIAAVSGINPAAEVWFLSEGYSWTKQNTISAGATSASISESVNWARDGHRYAMMLRPINTTNGWTGRDQNLGYVRKMALPYYISPQFGSQTRRGGIFRPEEDTEFQGASAGGLNTAYAFYGTRWYDQLSDWYVGYTLNVTSAQISISRYNSGGLGNAISPRLMVHRAEHGYGDLSFGGGYDSTALSRGDTAWCAAPPSWVEYMMQRVDNYKGLGLHHPNAALLSYAGNVSAEYMALKASEYGSLDGRPLFTVRVYHDG